MGGGRIWMRLSNGSASTRGWRSAGAAGYWKDDYNPYIQKLCHLNSVATIVIPDRAAAEDPFVAQAIEHASALFISGGDQANYINFWQETPVQTALNDAIKRGVPIGGTSAGLRFSANTHIQRKGTSRTIRISMAKWRWQTRTVRASPSAITS